VIDPLGPTFPTVPGWIRTPYTTAGKGLARLNAVFARVKACFARGAGGERHVPEGCADYSK